LGYVAAHVADGGDAVGNEQWNDEFAAACGFARTHQVDVHVGQAGDEKFAGGVDDAGAGGDFDGGVRAHGGDFFVVDEDCGV
jgi:hypothetical protein